MAGRCFGIFIGIDSVALPGICRLTEAALDAERMHDIFLSSFALDRDRSILLTDSHARSAPSRDDVHEALEAVRGSDARPDDAVIFWFSGHGFEAEDRTYLAVGNTEHTSRVHQQHTAVSLDTVRAYLDEIRVRTQIIVLDTCRTGIETTRSGMESGAPMTSAMRGALHRETRIRSKSTNPSRAVILSCDEGEVAYEDRGVGGRFTRSMCETLAGMPLGSLPISDWFDRTCQHLRTHWGTTQTPQLVLHGNAGLPRLHRTDFHNPVPSESSPQTPSHGQPRHTDPHTESDDYAMRAARFLIDHPPHTLTYFDAQRMGQRLAKYAGPRASLAQALLRLIVSHHFSRYNRRVPAEYAALLNRQCTPTPADLACLHRIHASEPTT